MTRPKAVIVVIVVALAFAGLASWMVYDYLQKEAQKSKATAGQNIVVAAVDIPVGARINPNQVKLVGWPKESIPPGSFTDTKAVTEPGRTAMRPLSAGEPVTEAKLIPKEGTPGATVMSYIIPTGHRAVTVAVNEVAGVAGFLSPNNKVDIVLTAIPNNSGNPISKIVLQNVPILATGQLTQQKEDKPVVVPTVTLDMTPEDSEKLIVASSKGSLQMLLRNITDTAVVETKGATITKVLGGIEAPAPKVVAKKAPVKNIVKTVQAKPTPPPHAPSPYKVEVVKGTNKSTREFAPEK